MTDDRITIAERAVKALRADFHGELITLEDAAYGEACRVWNGMIDRYPALIARCAGTPDVGATLAFARNEGLPLAVRGGGHSGAGFGVCDSGVVIDLSLMRTVHVDHDTMRARVGGAPHGPMWTPRPRPRLWR